MTESTVGGGSAAQRTAPRNSALGAYGERVAARHLIEAGMVVLARNWRCAAGELDLVAREGDVLAVCEVKTRRSVDFEHPCAAVSREKAARLRLLAERWIAAHPHLVRPGCDVRIDMIAVVPAQRGAARVEHVRGAC